MVLASGALAAPTRVKSRYTKLARTSRSNTPIAPVADMLQQEQPHHHFRRGSSAPASAALRTPSRQSLINGGHQLLVLQHFVGVLHPVLPKIAHFLGDETFSEVELLSAPQS